jgi:hypothetical protein
MSLARLAAVHRADIEALTWAAWLADPSCLSWVPHVR